MCTQLLETIFLTTSLIAPCPPSPQIPIFGCSASLAVTTVTPAHASTITTRHAIETFSAHDPLYDRDHGTPATCQPEYETGTVCI
jgi:hypothetical protein